MLDAWPLLTRFAQDPDAEVREQVARSLYVDADEHLLGRLELLISLTRDADVSARRAAAHTRLDKLRDSASSAPTPTP